MELDIELSSNQKKISLVLNQKSWHNIEGFRFQTSSFGCPQPPTPNTHNMTLIDVDRELLQSCVQGKYQAWESFVDRFAGTVLQVIDHVSAAHSQAISENEREKLCLMMFAKLRENRFALLKSYRGKSTFASFLVVHCRRFLLEYVSQNHLATR